MAAQYSSDPTQIAFRATRPASISVPMSAQPIVVNSKEQPAAALRGGARRKWVIPTIVVVVICVIVAAVVGGVVGSRNANHSSNNKVAAAAGASSSSSTAGATTTAKGKAAATATSSAAKASATAAGLAVVDLPMWDWSQNKSIGMCLGSWLSLERWMLEDWWVSVANDGVYAADVYDEWNLTAAITATPGGVANLTAVLQEHQDTWITDADIDNMKTYGINMLRIPLPFYAFIPTVEGEPYLNNSALYQASLTRIRAKAHSVGLYSVLDLHGLPGSQNGEESSGHNTTSPAWFGNAVNQGRSDDTVAAVLAYIAASPYRSSIAGLEIINEPRPYGDAQVAELEDYYSRSYATVQAAEYPVAVFIHGAFVSSPLNYWWDFVAARATSPPSLIFEDHPYPGNFPPQNGTADILYQVCNDAKNYLSYPVPICITEWSVYTGVKTTAFETQLYEAQLVTWAWSAGGMYWSYKVVPSQLQLAAGLDYSQYGFLNLLNSSGVITEGTTTSLSAAEKYLAGLGQQCGAAPDNVAPYNNGSVTVTTWSAEVSAASVAATETLYAPAETASVAARMRRAHKGVH